SLHSLKLQGNLVKVSTNLPDQTHSAVLRFTSPFKTRDNLHGTCFRWIFDKEKLKTLGQLDTSAARPVRTSISRTINKTGDERETRDGRKNRLSQWRLRARERSKGFRARQRIQRR